MLIQLVKQQRVDAGWLDNPGSFPPFAFGHLLQFEDSVIELEEGVSLMIGLLR